MPVRKPWTREETVWLIENYAKLGPKECEKRLTGRTWVAITVKARNLGLKFTGREPTKGFSVDKPATVNRAPDEVIADQARSFREKRERWESKHDGIRIDVHEAGPYGILFFGDAHGDDDGFDFERFSFDLQLVKDTRHLFGANMGDLTNNWIGRLSHLWGVQHVTSDEAIGIADWIIQSIEWLFVILGNHDKWRNDCEILCKKSGVTHVSHGGRFDVHCGDSVLRIEARHDHPGRSMYNPSHGQLKKNFRGSSADVIIGAHTHNSAYTQIKNGVTGKIGHAIRVGSYKKFDEYADALGFEDESISPSVLCVIDPSASVEGFVTVWHDTQQGAEYLTFLRSKHDGEEAKNGASRRVPRRPSDQHSGVGGGRQRGSALRRRGQKR